MSDNLGGGEYDGYNASCNEASGYLKSDTTFFLYSRLGTSHSW